jgi:hypothetical protein
MIDRLRSSSAGAPWGHCLFSLIAAIGLLAVGCTPFRSTVATPEKVDKEPPPLTPRQTTLRVSQYVFSADFELKADQPIFKDLSNLREQVFKELQLPPSNTLVQVYLFEDRDRYESFMKSKYPDLPQRRAFFVAQPRSVGGADDLLVYTFWGDKVQQDLRHELTHALLHSVLKDVPLWLDEGLAQYFELPADWKGLNRQHVESLRKGAFQPDLARLEQMSQVQQMSPAEYRESWAWTHLMLQGPPEGKGVLLAYLQMLRTNPSPGPLGPRLVAAVPELNEALDLHLARLEKVTPR